jgi:hypothetical protein
MSQGRKSAHGGAELTEPRDQCVWMEADETILIEYVTINCSQGGDGMNFDHTFWVAAATEMEGHPCLGAGKTVAACQSKWGWVCTTTISALVPSLMIEFQLCATFNVVDKVTNASGLSYSMEHGALITPESENMWTDFVKVK